MISVVNRLPSLHIVHGKVKTLERVHTTIRVVVLLWALTACPLLAVDDRLTEITGPTMGTTYRVKVVDLGSPSDLRRSIKRRLQKINELMSTYIGESEVSRFNRWPANKWFPVSQETYQVVALAQDIACKTDGAFDITVGPLVRLWNFGAKAERSKAFAPPSQADIRKTLKVIGFKKLELRAKPPSLRKTTKLLEIDLSAIAKGYAVDQVAELLRSRKQHDFMVEIGGEICVAGRRPDGQRWSIGIEQPDARGRRVSAVLRPHNSGIATSGDYRNFREYDGVRYSHTIDPRTGRPVNHQLASVTVLSADCATADAFATAMLVLGPGEGKVWAERNKVAALLLSRSQGQTTRTQTTYFDIASLGGKSQPSSSFMRLFSASAVVFAIALLAMSIGVLFGRRRIQGSCGGLSELKDENGKTMCEACTNPSPTCRGEQPAGLPVEAK